MKDINTNTILVGIIGVLVGGIVGYAIANTGGWHGKKYSDRDGYSYMNTETGRFDDDTWRHGMPGGHNMHDMMVTSEKAFLEHMIPHHQEAVDTAKEVLARGATTPEIKTLMENIVAAQEKEIADMKEWYQAWYGEQFADTGTYTPMMRDLESLSGAELDRAFLGDMIMHHMGAIMMARSVSPYIEHSEISDLTKAIITTQSEEIVLMQRLLKELGS